MMAAVPRTAATSGPYESGRAMEAHIKVDWQAWSLQAKMKPDPIAVLAMEGNTKLLDRGGRDVE
jgi:hypothetical protein